MYFWRHEIPAAPGRRGVQFAFTSRRAGVSVAPYDALNLGGRTGDDVGSVERNRALLATSQGVPRDRLLFMNQCHSNDVAVVDGPWPAKAADVDALVTTRDDLVLAALSADCVPVLLGDTRAGVVSAVHAGRPGMLAGVAVRAVDAMVGAGAVASDIEAVVGPSVCGRCYEVPESMRVTAASVSPVSATVSWSGTPAMDVAAGVVAQLTSRGVRVTWVPGCTREEPDLYSYRRDGRTGRFAGVVRLVSGNRPVGAGS